MARLVGLHCSGGGHITSQAPAGMLTARPPAPAASAFSGSSMRQQRAAAVCGSGMRQRHAAAACGSGVRQQRAVVAVAVLTC